MTHTTTERKARLIRWPFERVWRIATTTADGGTHYTICTNLDTWQEGDPIPDRVLRWRGFR